MKHEKDLRTKRKAGIRITPKELERLNAELERAGLSFADWVIDRLAERETLLDDRNDHFYTCGACGDSVSYNEAEYTQQIEQGLCLAHYKKGIKDRNESSDWLPESDNGIYLTRVIRVKK
jgi:hypothetical protein